MLPKNIIITGTSSGIGFELAKQLALAGHNILALSRNSKPISKLNINNIHSLSADITDESQIEIVKDYISSNFNEIDILINNAGYLINKPFEKLTKNDFFDVYNVNVFAVARLIQVVLPFLKKGSHVVNISSMGGVRGSVKFPGLAAYSSSKAAVFNLTELLAEEYKDSGIAFNALALGSVQTEMLNRAFPNYKAQMSAENMADYISNFALTSNKYKLNTAILELR